MHMEFSWLIGYLLAGSFLLQKILVGLPVILNAGHTWLLHRIRGIRLAAAEKSFHDHGLNSWTTLMIWLACGFVFALALIQRFLQQPYSLFLLVMSGFILAGFHQSSRTPNLPEVIFLMRIYCAARMRGYPPFDALCLVAVKTPDGFVNDAVNEALKRQRRGLALDDSLIPLQCCHPYLKAFFTCHPTLNHVQADFQNQLVWLHRAKKEYRNEGVTTPLTMIIHKIFQPTQNFIVGDLLATLWLTPLNFQHAVASIWQAWFARMAHRDGSGHHIQTLFNLKEVSHVS